MHLITFGIILLYKLQAYDVQDKLLSPLRNYFQKCKQRVFLNNQVSEWREINSGVP